MSPISQTTGQFCDKNTELVFTLDTEVDVIWDDYDACTGLVICWSCTAYCELLWEYHAETKIKILVDYETKRQN